MLLDEFSDNGLTIKPYRKGDFIYHQNATARSFYEVRSGEIAILNVNDDGKEFIQGIYKSGDCFGVASLVYEKAYTASAIAYTDCVVNLLSRELFFQELKNNYVFHFNITRIVCGQLLYKTMMLEEVANEEGEHRLLTLIHYLMAQKTPDNKSLDTTRQQLADMTGLRVETVIRILKKLEDQGKVSSKRGRIFCLTNKKSEL